MEWIIGSIILLGILFIGWITDKMGLKIGDDEEEINKLPWRNK